MRSLIFIMITIAIAYYRYTIPPGSPDFLVVWLVTLAFYTENKWGVFQAFWIGILHGFPDINPFSPLIAILAYKALQHQRFHIGRDHFLPRFLIIAALTTIYDAMEWLSLAPYLKPDIYSSLQLFGTHAAFTAIMGLPLLSFGQRMENILGFRQTRYDF